MKEEEAATKKEPGKKEEAKKPKETTKGMVVRCGRMVARVAPRMFLRRCSCCLFNYSI
jgi:hypothetical protein